MPVVGPDRHGEAMRCMGVGVTECGARASPNATVQQLGDNPTKTVIPAKAGTHVMFRR